ncbi:hypothetical protein M8C21_030118, partial [Ambrosia artemisiifolia]
LTPSLRQFARSPYPLPFRFHASSYFSSSSSIDLHFRMDLRLIGNIRMLSKNTLIFLLLSSNLPLALPPNSLQQVDNSIYQIGALPSTALSEKGYVKRMKLDTFNLQNRGTIGKSVGKLRVNDTMSDFLACRAHDHLLYFSDKGTVYSAPAYKIPECSRVVAVTHLIQILALSDGERITSIIPVSEFAEDRSSGIIALQLVPGDSLKWVRHCTDEDYVAMSSQNGFVILSSCEIYRALGRHTRGSVAMRLKEKDRMACVDIIPAAKQDGIEHVHEPGHKQLQVFLRRPDHLAAVFVVSFTTAEDGESDEQVVLVSQSGTVNRIKVRDIPIQSRYA